MLIKSRAEGNKKLRMEDRFHLEVLRLWDAGDDCRGDDDDRGTRYRFFSRQTTAGRAASTVAANLGDERAAEFLATCPPPGASALKTGEKCYRRLPSTMTLGDAEAQGWIKEFDAVVVRVYSLVDDNGGAELGGPSMSVFDPDDDGKGDASAYEEGEKELAAEESPTKDTDVDNSKDDIQLKEAESQRPLQRRIHEAFQSTDAADGKLRKKKKPPSRQMRSMMKSKSKGDKRLNHQDRIYLEVVLFSDDGAANVTASSLSTSSRFFSGRDHVGKIIAVCSGDTSLADVDGPEFVVPSPNGAPDRAYAALRPDMTLGEAVRGGYVENFGRVVVRVRVDGVESLPMHIGVAAATLGEDRSAHEGVRCVFEAGGGTRPVSVQDVAC